MTMMAPTGAGTPVKKFTDQTGLFGSSAITLKRASRKPMQIANTSAAIQPTERNSFRPQKYRIRPGHHAEIDEVGKAVELGAEFRLAFQHARQPSVDAVERGREHDRAQSPVEPPLDRQPDGRQSRAQRKQGDQIGQQHAHRNGAKAPPAGLQTFGIDGRKHHDCEYSNAAGRTANAAKRRP